MTDDLSGTSLDSFSETLAHQIAVISFCILQVCYVGLIVVAAIVLVMERVLVHKMNHTKKSLLCDLSEENDFSDVSDDDSMVFSSLNKSMAEGGHSDWMSWFCFLFLAAVILRSLCTFFIFLNAVYPSVSIYLCFLTLQLIAPQPEYVCCFIIAGTWVEFISVAHAIHKGKFNNSGNTQESFAMDLITTVGIAIFALVFVYAMIASVAYAFDAGVGISIFFAFIDFIWPIQQLFSAIVFLACTIALVVISRKVLKGFNITKGVINIIIVSLVVFICYSLRSGVSIFVVSSGTQWMMSLVPVTTITELLPLCLILYLYLKRIGNQKESAALHSQSVESLSG